MSPSERSSSQFPYRKLPGDFRGIFRRYTLWLASDHLLMVDSTRFSETYKRFYLRDIQTIIIRKTARFVLPYYWLLLAVFAFIFFVLFVAYPNLRPREVGWLAVAIFTAVAVYLYVASMFQSCTCHLVTRVSKVELRSLFRLRAARKFVDIMAPLIAGVQGELPEGWIERSTTLAELSTAADRNPDAPVDVLPAGTFNGLSVVVFVCVLLDACFAWQKLTMRNANSFSAPNVINMIALALCATIAIVQLSRQKGGVGVRRLVIAGLLVVAGVTYGGVLLQSFDQQFYHRTFHNALDYPGMQYLDTGEIGLDVIVGVAGLIFALRQPRIKQNSTAIFDKGAPPV